MQLKGMEKEGPFTTLYYELTWRIGWDQMISFVNAIIKSDFSKNGIQSIEVGTIAGAKGKDVTEMLKSNNNNIKDTEFAKDEAGFIAIAGVSNIMEVSMRITLWNQTNQFMLQIVNDSGIEKCGKHCYDKYVDSIEIMGHVDYTKDHIS